jgi:hypothetical protein
MNWDSSVGLVTMQQAGQQANCGLILKGSRPFATANQLPIQWVIRPLSQGKSGHVTKLIINLHLISNLRTHGAIPPLLIYLHLMHMDNTFTIQ